MTELNSHGLLMILNSIVELSSRALTTYSGQDKKLFQQNGIRKMFEVKTERNDNLKYVGLNIFQRTNQIR